MGKRQKETPRECHIAYSSEELTQRTVKSVSLEDRQ